MLLRRDARERRSFICEHSNGGFFISSATDTLLDRNTVNCNQTNWPMINNPCILINQRQTCTCVAAMSISVTSYSKDSSVRKDHSNTASDSLEMTLVYSFMNQLSQSLLLQSRSIASGLCDPPTPLNKAGCIVLNYSYNNC